MSDNSWIVWQNACEKMHGHFLTELRRLLANKAVTTHADILEAMEDVYHPIMPKCTVDIAQDAVTIKAGKGSKVTNKQVMEAVNNAVLSAKIIINEPPTKQQLKTSGRTFKDIADEKERRIQQAINEIGVPNKDYPANIANAYDVLMGNAICKGEPK